MLAILPGAASGLAGILADMRFRATVELRGKTATWLRVPDDIVADTAPREVTVPVDGLRAGRKTH